VHWIQSAIWIVEPSTVYTVQALCSSRAVNDLLALLGALELSHPPMRFIVVEWLWDSECEFTKSQPVLDLSRPSIREFES